LVAACGSTRPHSAGRFGGPDELIGALLWLCGPRASFVNAVVVPVDGGFSAFSGA
jgi:NAD(P)-dependent dehydrogenase (short-subunit alcohol dehydrogenase family)